MCCLTESKTVVRKIHAREVPGLLPCARAFCSVIPDCPLDEQSFVNFVSRVIDGGIGTVFVIEKDGEFVGAIGAIMNPDFLTGRKSAAELFWFVQPEHRGSSSIRMLKMLEDWSVENDCHTLHMVHLECSMADKLPDMYQRMGYRKFETWWRKEIN